MHGPYAGSDKGCVESARHQNYQHNNNNNNNNNNETGTGE
jgi:hypothetical protein